MNKKEISFLLVKQVRIMEEINKLNKILNEDIIDGIREASDFTDYIMDEIGLPDEGEECIATDDFEHLKNGNKKLGNKIYTFDLPAIISCPNHTECAKDCYADKGTFLWKDAKL